LIERPDWNDFKARAGAARSRNRDAQCRMGGRAPACRATRELPAWATASAIVFVLSGFARGRKKWRRPTTCAKMRGSPRWIRIMSDEGIVIERRHWIYRHALATRVTHWINAVCLLILLLSGLQIFNAHPALYFGAKSDFEAPSLEMKATTAENIASGAALRSAQSLTRRAAAKAKKPSEDEDDEDDEDESDQPMYRGVVVAFGRVFDTTGWFGYAYGPDGQLTPRGFPSSLTLPGERSLATARRWHFTFAWLLVLNGFLYLAFAFATGHVRRDLWASRREWRDIPHAIWQHIRLRFPEGDEARRYNVLQKLAYLAIIFIVIPVMVLTGMTMSPGLDARFPFLAPLFGGRQTARTIHFILAFGLVAFAFIHIAMVILAGFANNMRSMITGRYVIASKQRELHEPAPPASS